MSIYLSRPRSILAKVANDLDRLRTEQRGTVAVIMAFLFPILIGGFGLGMEVTNWYLITRSMQNAADAAAIAASANNSSNYNVEAAAVAAQYGYVNGSNNVTVTVSNTAACPAGGNTCVSVTISKTMPLFLTEVVGFSGDATLNGAAAKNLAAIAIANGSSIKTPICLLTLSQIGTGLRTNGAPKADFSGCTVMSDSSATCNGSNLNADWGIAHATNNGCGNNQKSNAPIVPDPYLALANNIPKNTCGSYPQEPAKKKDPPLPASNQWTGSKSLGSGTTEVCGDLQLTGDVTINTTDLSGAVLVIENGQLDLNGYTLQTSNGSALTIIFSGDDKSGTYTHAPTGGGTLDFQAPTSGTWSGVALYQDPNLLNGVDVSYSGNSPTWDITGLVYMPNANVTFSGAVNKSNNGADCFVMVAYTVLVNGTGMIYQQSPDGSGCKQAGLNQPTVTIPGRGQLLF